MNDFAMDLAACRHRQARLLEVMHQQDLELVVLARREHILWLTGVYVEWYHEPLAAVAADGHVTLIAPNQVPEQAAADTVDTYPAQVSATLRNDQRELAAGQLARALAARTWTRVGAELSAAPGHLLTWPCQWLDVEPDLIRLRRRKQPDELRRMRHAIAATERMYVRARELVRPGITELEMYNELQTVAVQTLGERLTGTGNDYQCASPGGPPRADRAAKAGELYILDLGPAFRGYFADNCRTIAVTDADTAQQQAHAQILRVLEYVEATAAPGVRCRMLFENAAAMLSQATAGRFTHHLGHGVGLFPHEPPHLNPAWDDTLEIGDVFTVEPGLYAPELRAGIRIEDNYLVTDAGVQRLTPFSREM